MALSPSEDVNRVMTLPVGQTDNSRFSGAGYNQQSLTDQVIEVQQLSHASQSTVTRRALWFWLRVYVRDRKQKVTNVRLPIPIPLVGLFFPRQLDTKRALNLVDLLYEDAANPAAAREYLDTLMPVEFVRVDGDGELVIVGLE